ncbi:MAG: YdaU family protein [Acinetobacter sp.]
MNYYQHHIGDFMRDTAHLSPVEECFYRRALDWYYVNEKPLPLDLDQVNRYLRAKTKTDRTAIGIVLSDFFKKTASGFVHSRCEIELEKFRCKKDASRENGKLGGRPKKNNDLQNLGVSDGLELGLNLETQNNLNQEPITNNQEPVTNINITADESAKNPKPKRVTKKQLAVEALVNMGIESKYAEAVIEKRKGSAFTDLAIEEIKLQAEAVNITFVEAIEFAAKQEWGSFRADWYQNRTSKQQPIATFQTAAQKTASEHDRWRQAEQQAFGERDVTPKKFLLIEEVGHA